MRVDVEDIVGTTTPSTEITHAELRKMVVSLACPSSIVHTPIAVAVDATSPAMGSPVQFVRVPEDGVPRTGVVRVGLVRVLFVRVSVVARPTSVSLESCRVYVLLALAVLVKKLVKVFATLRIPNIPARKVFSPLTVCVEARTISPPPEGVANVPSHRRNVVVLFGGVGTAPQTVDVIAGRSAFVAVVNIPLTSL